MEFWTHASRRPELRRRVAAASPYHRDLLGPDAASGDVPLAELPTLPKATLMDNFDRIVTDPGCAGRSWKRTWPGRTPGGRSSGGTGCSPPPAPPGARLGPADTPARVRAALVRELHDAGAVPPRIEVTPVPAIDRDPGHGAKLKLVRQDEQHGGHSQ